MRSADKNLVRLLLDASKFLTDIKIEKAAEVVASAKAVITSPALADGGRRLPAPAPMIEVPKITIGEINPVVLGKLSDQEIFSLNRRTHQLYGAHFAGNDRTSANSLSREVLINAQIFLIDEMKRRGIQVDMGTDLNKEAETARKLLTEKNQVPSWIMKATHEGAMVAIAAPSSIRKELRKLGLLKAPNAEPNNLHVTLLYLGKASSIDEPTRDQLRQAIAAVGKQHAKLEMKISGFGEFHPGQDGVPIYAVANGKGLSQLQADLEKAVSKIIKLPTEHGWVPHMTLGYLKDGETFKTPQLTNENAPKWTASEVDLVFSDKHESFKLEGPGSPYADIHPSGENDGPPIALEEITPHFAKPMLIRSPAVFLVGSTANNGKGNDIDILIDGPFDEQTRHVLQFRLGRALPPKLSQRIQFHDEQLGGPFTCHVPLYDLALIPHKDRRVIEMVEKQADPYLEFPPKANEKHSAVFQFHFRGKSAHADLRIQMNPRYLIGWTISLAKAGEVPDVETLETGRTLSAQFDIDGSRWNKPILAPNKLFAVPKPRHPTEWIKLKEQVIKPGTVGATRFEAGVFTILDKCNFEWGMQKPFFHEYFPTGSKFFNGILYFRQLVGREAPGAAQVEEGRRTPAGKTFWNVWLSKEYLPTVLKKRQVDKKAMPPDGHSAMPKSLMEQTPEQFRFWDEKGEAARKMRDALVAEKYFTQGNLELIRGEIRRVERKVSYFIDGKEYTEQQAKRAKFSLAWQWWKGQAVIRAAPSRQVWHLAIDRPDGVEVFTLVHNPLGEERQITATRSEDKTDELLEFKGEVEPGQKVGGTVRNETKATPSTIEQLDSGTADLLEDGDAFKKIRFDGKELKGVWVLAAEEPGGPIWSMSKSEGVGKAEVPTKDGIQIWDPESKIDDVDRTDLKPLAIFQPMKPASGNEFKDLEEASEKFGTEEALSGGVYVEPKWNGFRIVAEKKGDRVLIFTEDRKRDISDNLPNVTKELKAIDEDFILDTELMEFLPDGSPVPRRELAEFRGKKPVDDSDVRLMVFHVLFSKDGNLTDAQLSDNREKLEAFFKRNKTKHLALTEPKLVKSDKQLADAVDWASRVPGSEGAMFKHASSTYTLGGQTSSWGKLKKLRTVRAIIYDRHPVKDAPGVYNFLCAIGPVPEKEKDRWKETVEVKGKLYTPIGRTFNSKLAANVGDSVEVEITEMVVDQSAPKWKITWFTPMVVGKSDTHMTVAEIVRLGEPSEVKKYIRLLPVEKGEEEQRIVYGIVLEPDSVDSQGDTVTAEEIAQAAHEWLARKQNRGVMHRELANGKIEIYESYIAPQDLTIGGQRVKKGSWLLMCHILCDKLWAKIKSGELEGYSMGGFGRRIHLQAA